jgi:hypothetical protein
MGSWLARKISFSFERRISNLKILEPMIRGQKSCDSIEITIRAGCFALVCVQFLMTGFESIQNPIFFRSYMGSWLARKISFSFERRISNL